MKRTGTPSETFTIKYQYALDDGTLLQHAVTIDKETLLSTCDSSESPPEWTRLSYSKCDGCTLTDSEYCPVALRLVTPLKAVKNLISHAHVKTTVVTQERTYMKEVDVQEALRSLFGLIIATSGCPAMKPFKLMARYHLPFSSLDETICRVTSAYLMRQFFRHRQGKNLPIDLHELESLYNTMKPVNEGIASRIRAAVESDGALNAIVIFNSFSQLIPFVLDEELEKLKPLFE